MNQKSRLDRVEGSLGPVAAVVRQFTAAHEFGSFTAYAAHEAGLPKEARAQFQIASQVQSSVARSIEAGSSADATAAGVRAARDAVFRFRLAWKLEFDVSIVLASLRDVRDELLADRKALVAADQLRPDAEAGASADLFEWLTAMEAGYANRAVDYVRDLFTQVEVRAILERRYFDGRSMLFPDSIALEQELLALPPILADVFESATSDRWPGADIGAEERGPPGARFATLKDEAHILAADLAARMVNIVRIDTLLTLGEYERAYTLELALDVSGAGPMMRIVTTRLRHTPRRQRR
jgi:hypothetical protein